MAEGQDKNEVKYIVGLAKNPRLQELSKDLQIKAEAVYNETYEKVKLFTESNMRQELGNTRAE